MTRSVAARLNDSGEEGLTRLFRRGAVHFSEGSSTSRHAHYAWKIHVGLDAPVWLDVAGGRRIEASVLVVPPNLLHATGAHGVSLAAFVAPGSRGTGWRGTSEGGALPAKLAARVVGACRRFEPGARGDTALLVDELSSLALTPCGEGIDARVEAALRRLDADLPLSSLAAEVGLSLDRLSRLVSRETGLTLRRHAIWSKLMRLLSSPDEHPTLAAAAVAAGFSDHAHMTRTYRAYLGRAPSDFRGPPDIVAPW